MSDDEPDLDDFEAWSAWMARKRETVLERLRMTAQLLDAGEIGTKPVGTTREEILQALTRPKREP